MGLAYHVEGQGESPNYCHTIGFPNQGSTGNTQSHSGNIQSLLGNNQSHSGNIQSPSGNIQSSRPARQSKGTESLYVCSVEQDSAHCLAWKLLSGDCFS
jgi:hypothetical protein